MNSGGILIVDDHEMVAHALARMLLTEKSFGTVDTATTCEDALRLTQQRLYDLVLMDVQLPGRSGFDVASQVASRGKRTRILFLTGQASSIHVRQVMMQGASGLVVKGCSLAFLVEACVRSIRGEQVFSPDLLPFVEKERQAAESNPDSMNGLAALSPRQLEVARHLAAGCSIKEVAARMHLSEKTIDSHNSRIMKVLGIHSRVELAKLAIREGLVSL
jgi:DNA-binding NarL/FixJ family response regulator